MCRNLQSNQFYFFLPDRQTRIMIKISRNLHMGLSSEENMFLLDSSPYSARAERAQFFNLIGWGVLNNIRLRPHLKINGPSAEAGLMFKLDGLPRRGRTPRHLYSLYILRIGVCLHQGLMQSYPFSSPSSSSLPNPPFNTPRVLCFSSQSAATANLNRTMLAASHRTFSAQGHHC